MNFALDRICVYMLCGALLSEAALGVKLFLSVVLVLALALDCGMHLNIVHTGRAIVNN